jgi:hypothetical protein
MEQMPNDGRLLKKVKHLYMRQGRAFDTSKSLGGGYVTMRDR